MKCLITKGLYAAALVPLVSDRGIKIQRSAELRGYSTSYRGKVALALSSSLTREDAEDMIQCMARYHGVPAQESRQFLVWLHRSYAGRIFGITWLEDVRHVSDIATRDPLHSTSWSDGCVVEYFWLLRQAWLADGSLRPEAERPRIYKPEHAPLVTRVCTGCVSGAHYKSGRRGVGPIEGNYHLRPFDVSLGV